MSGTQHDGNDITPPPTSNPGGRRPSKPIMKHVTDGFSHAWTWACEHVFSLIEWAEDKWNEFANPRPRAGGSGTNNNDDTPSWVEIGSMMVSIIAVVILLFILPWSAMWNGITSLQVPAWATDVNAVAPWVVAVISMVAAVDMLVGSIRRRSVMDFFRRNIYWGLAGAAGLGLMLSLGGLSWPSLVAAIIVVFLVRGVFYVVAQNQLRLRWAVAVLFLLAVTIGGTGLWTGAWNTTSTKAFIASTFNQAEDVFNNVFDRNPKAEILADCEAAFNEVYGGQASDKEVLFMVLDDEGFPVRYCMENVKTPNELVIGLDNLADPVEVIRPNGQKAQMIIDASFPITDKGPTQFVAIWNFRLVNVN